MPRHHRPCHDTHLFYIVSWSRRRSRQDPRFVYFDFIVRFVTWIAFAYVANSPAVRASDESGEDSVIGIRMENGASADAVCARCRNCPSPMRTCLASHKADWTECTVSASSTVRSVSSGIKNGVSRIVAKSWCLCREVGEHDDINDALGAMSLSVDCKRCVSACAYSSSPSLDGH